MAAQFLNDPETAVVDGLEGLTIANPGLILLKEEVNRKYIDEYFTVIQKILFKS